MSTTIAIAKTNIDIEKLKLELSQDSIVGVYRILEILPGLTGHVTLSDVLPINLAAVTAAVGLVVTDHVTAKDATIFKVTADLHVDQDLDVEGDNTVFNTETVTIEDNIITLNKNAVGVQPDGFKSGIEIERGSETNAQMIFDETTGTWQYVKGDDPNYYSLYSKDDPNSGLLPRNKVATGLINSILFNSAGSSPLGLISESSNFKWFETTLASGSTWKGLDIGNGFDMNLAQDSKIMWAGNPTTHFINVKAGGTMQICDDNAIEFWQGDPTIPANKRFLIGADIRSYNDISVIKTTPIIQLEPLSGLSNGLIRSYFPVDGSHADHIRHSIQFHNNDDLSIVSQYGQTIIQSATVTSFINNGLNRFQTSSVDHNRSFADLIIQKTTPVLWFMPGVSDTAAIENFCANHVGNEVRHQILFLANDDLFIGANYGDSYLNAGGDYVYLQVDAVNKLRVSSTGARLYGTLVVDSAAPSIQLTSSSGACEIRTTASGGGGHLHVTAASNLYLASTGAMSLDADSKITISANASPGIVQLNAITLETFNAPVYLFYDHESPNEKILTYNDTGSLNQFKFLRQTIFTQYVNFQDHVEFTSVDGVDFTGPIFVADSIRGTYGGFQDLVLYNNNTSAWTLTHAFGGLQRFIPSGANTNNSIGYSTYPIEEIYVHKIKGYGTSRSTGPITDSIWFYDNSNTTPAWIMDVAEVESVDVHYIRPNLGVPASLGRAGSVGNRRTLIDVVTEKVTYYSPDGSSIWTIEALNNGNLSFKHNNVIQGHVDDTGFHSA